jgi:hypothetical protein
MLELKPKSQPNFESNIEFGIYPVGVFASHTLKLSKPLIYSPHRSPQESHTESLPSPFILTNVALNYSFPSLATSARSFTSVPRPRFHLHRHQRTIERRPHREVPR